MDRKCVMLSVGAGMLFTSVAGAQPAPSAPSAPSVPAEAPAPVRPPPPPLPPMWPQEELPALPAPPRAEPPPPLPIWSPARRNPEMMLAGIILSGAGLATLPVGIALAAAVNGKGDPVSINVELAAIVMISLGATLLPAVGIPLWVNGAKPRRRWDEVAIPSVAAGPRSVTVRWTF